MLFSIKVRIVVFPIAVCVVTDGKRHSWPAGCGVLAYRKYRTVSGSLSLTHQRDKRSRLHVSLGVCAACVASASELRIGFRLAGFRGDQCSVISAHNPQPLSIGSCCYKKRSSSHHAPSLPQSQVVISAYGCQSHWVVGGINPPHPRLPVCVYMYCV